MNHSEVQLIGVFDPDDRDEGFCYSVNAPRNLWIQALCSDGSRMGHHFMAYVLNELIENDCFNPGDGVIVADREGTRIRAKVGVPVFGRDVEAFQAQTQFVLPVSVEVLE